MIFRRRIIIEADSIVANKMSGIGHTTLELIRELENFTDKFKITIIVPYGKKQVVEKYGFKNVLVRSLPPGYRYVNYALTRTSLPIPVDIIYGRGIYIFPNYKTWWLLFSRSVTFVDDVAFKIYPETINPKNLAYLNANFDTWLKRSNKIITISRSAKKEFEKFFPLYRNKVETVYLGINPLVFYPRDKNEISKVLNKYNFPNKSFLFIGNLEPRKNILNLLEAYSSYCVISKIKLPLLIIGGDGWKNNDIHKKIKDLQKTGHKVIVPDRYVSDDDLPAIYTSATALVHVAIHEGFGLPPLQAQSCGTPVIASNLSVFHETLKKENTYYVDPTNINQIANFMIKAEKQFSRNRIKNRTNLTWENTVMNLFKIIDTMV